MAEKREMNVILIRHTLSPEELVSLGAKLCYSKATISDLNDRISAQDQTAFIDKLMNMGHESIFEHASFTFGIEGVSRVLLAQLTRHRLASFSVQSQRYVSYEKGFGFIIPPKIESLGEEAVGKYVSQMNQIEEWYREWQQLLGKGEHSNEDARFILPNACETRILLTMNVRELWHFFALRMCNRAQWEINELATRMHRICLETAPALFKEAGPACLRGKCPEGEKTCGMMMQKRSQREELLNAVSKQKEEC